jgi:hypothetical protein
VRRGLRGSPEAEGEAPEEPESKEEEDTEGSCHELDIPEGLDLSDLNPGEEKEVLCVIRKVSDTEACFKQVDGIDLAGAATGGMAGPPPAAPPAPPGMPPGGPGGPPPGAPPPELLAAMMGAGGPPPGLPPGPPEPPGAPVRRRAARAGLM